MCESQLVKKNRKLFSMARFWLFFTIMLSIIVFSGCHGNTENTGPKMLATISYHDRGFDILNDNDFKWINVKYYLNYSDEDLSSGYKYVSRSEWDKRYGITVDAGMYKNLALYDFKNQKGEGFSGRPFRLLIQAETKEGKPISIVETFE